jgi:polyhydroxyalkanoate synthase
MATSDGVVALRRDRSTPESRVEGPVVEPVEAPRLEAPERHALLSLDRAFRANVARFTLGVTPAGLAGAYFDWLSHLWMAPGKRLQLVEKAARKAQRLGMWASHAAFDPSACPCIEPLPQDRRFADAAWCRFPYNVIYQSFLLTQQWWHNATTGVDGVEKSHEAVVAFAARQLLDVVSPSNSPLTNPEIAAATLSEGGFNLVRGAQNFLEDWQRAVAGKRPVGAENYRPGREVAVTPGKVVYQNRLIEVIQYAPATPEVAAEPVLIVPAWIMKYYILDLSPENSLVRYLVEKGQAVFIVSWKNAGTEERELGLDDYRRLGFMAALDVVNAVVPGRKVHAVGYCLGGTLLAIAAAAMGRDGDDRLASMTLLAAQVDFSEAGELTLFISESEVGFLEDMMWDQGYLDTTQMAGAFQLLRSNDLIWSRMVREYLLGGRQKMNDLMAWNADATRMPYRMHSEYLRRLFLDNDLAQGHYDVDGKPVSISDIRVPCFLVGTTTDHVAPWRSVYKFHLAADTEVTYLLTTGGHNAGIVSPPLESARRSFQVRTHRAEERYLDPDTWLLEAERKEGSWWPEWQGWLARRSSGRAAPPPMGVGAHRRPLRDAPGLYVMQA